MKNNLIESMDSFKIKFKGKNSVDAELFTKTINETIELVKASANAIDKTSFLRLEIKANKEGSFETFIDAIVNNQETIFNAGRFACEAVSGFFNFLQIKEHLRGKRAKKVEKGEQEAIITNQENEIKKVPNAIATEYFANSKIENSIVVIFTELDDKKRDGLSIEHGDKKLTIDKKNYSHMKTKTIDLDKTKPTPQIQKPINVDLLLKKPDLLGDSAWGFVYNKNISCKIDDMDFLEKVHTRQIKALYAGVKIPCELQIEYELDDKYEVVSNSEKYTILKVTGDIIEPQDDNLDMFAQN